MKNKINSKMKKIIAYAVVCMIAFTYSTLPVFADDVLFGGGTGTEADPYLISTAQDLVELSTLSLSGSAASYNGKCYKVTADIDMTDVTDFKGIGWGVRFSGVFDGDYHIIKNLTFSSDGFAGFFNLADGATIKNLGLENTVISGSCAQGMGGFIGRNFNSIGTTTIENCYVRKMTLTNSNGSNHTGAFVGNESVAGIIIKNCYSTELSGPGIQGLVGNQYGAPQGGSTISNCYSTGTPWSKFATAVPPNTTNVYYIPASPATEEQMTGLGNAYAADALSINSGLPVLAWENERPSEKGTVTASAPEYKITDGTLSGSATIANYYIEDLPLSVCVVAYGKDNQMLFAKIYTAAELKLETGEAVIKSGEKKDISFSVENAEKIERIGLFLWNNLKNVQQYSVVE